VTILYDRPTRADSLRLNARTNNNIIQYSLRIINSMLFQSTRSPGLGARFRRRRLQNNAAVSSDGDDQTLGESNGDDRFFLVPANDPPQEIRYDRRASVTVILARFDVDQSIFRRRRPPMTVGVSDDRLLIVGRRRRPPLVDGRRREVHVGRRTKRVSSSSINKYVPYNVYIA